MSRTKRGNTHSSRACDEISVVIATKDRPDSLLRALRSIANQSSLPSEVIVIDSGQTSPEFEEQKRTLGPVTLHHIRSAPSLCRQRNLGINVAKHEWILICDDDIELPPDYIRDLRQIIETDPSIGAVTGRIVEPDASLNFETALPVPRPGALVFRFLFQLGVFLDLSGSRQAAGPDNYLTRRILRHYELRRNGYSHAGWPYLTDISTARTQVSVYGLGAALIRKVWLGISPYDIHLDERGVGDNYGVALAFPGDRPITLVPRVHVRHHRATGGRPSEESLLASRVFALDYFMFRAPRFTTINRITLRWSIIGLTLLYLVHGRWTMVKTGVAIFCRLCLALNPYVIRFQRSQQ